MNVKVICIFDILTAHKGSDTPKVSGLFLFKNSSYYCITYLSSCSYLLNCLSRQKAHTKTSYWNTACNDGKLAMSLGLTTMRLHNVISHHYNKRKPVQERAVFADRVPDCLFKGQTMYFSNEGCKIKQEKCRNRTLICFHFFQIIILYLE